MNNINFILSSPDRFLLLHLLFILVVLAEAGLGRVFPSVLEREQMLHQAHQAQLARNFRRFHCGHDRYNKGKWSPY